MAVRRRTIAIAASAVTAAAALTVTGVLLSGGGSGPARLVRPVASATPTTPTPSSGPLVSPFTGERVKALGPVLAVKIDNVVDARPPTGLTDADIVYLLPVEGGLSRIFAVFSSHFPSIIGPVRSAREDDIELLRQFGRPAFAYSGAQSHLLPVIMHARTVDLYAGTAAGYFRDPNRVIPHNLYANTSQLLAQARGASKAHDIGFRFGSPPPGGRATTSLSVAYPSASFSFRWSGRKARWLVSMDGSPALATEGGQLSAATVVIQYTKVRTSRFLEEGVPPPYAESTGAGTAVILRNGKAYNARWSRPRADGGTTFTTASGQPMTFAKGQVWIVFIAAP
jgi:Protein of unknown function (DUF3048) N-terminal domain/Protein of unknown function (DUF3048) C-terminal domain